MASITVTHYTSGENAPRYNSTEELLTVEAALTDMFNRLYDGAETTMSGHNYGLASYTGSDESLTSSDRAIYGGISSQIQNFLIRAAKWWEQEGNMKVGSPEHDQFIRRTLLSATGHTLTTDEMAVALAMPQDEFFIAMAMAVKENETVTELFRVSV